MEKLLKELQEAEGLIKKPDVALVTEKYSTSKSKVPITPTKLWNGCNPNLQHVRIWNSSAYMLKGKADKLESRTDVCFFVGYPRKTKGGLFYCPKDHKVIVSTNARFLEDDYVMNHKSKSRIVLEELRRDRLTHNSSIPIVQEEAPQDRVIDIPLPRCSGRNVVTQVDTETQHADTIKTLVSQPVHDDGKQRSESTEKLNSDTQAHVMPHRSRRVRCQLDRYMFLGESYNMIPNELNTKPVN
ncbi:uncharacterized protein LOC130768889 [Actinidia eriantha]|uniref:uncharacterized protein LOC130768889 n=1 Tax=Actinidia eriantha TaxID=165200 RepID=UPI00258E7A56|nr:uncharacterized protein LOC130768889 [Actinidia eriantha]